MDEKGQKIVQILFDRQTLYMPVVLMNLQYVTKFFQLILK